MSKFFTNSVLFVFTVFFGTKWFCIWWHAYFFLWIGSSLSLVEQVVCARIVHDSIKLLFYACYLWHGFLELFVELLNQRFKHWMFLSLFWRDWLFKVFWYLLIAWLCLIVQISCFDFVNLVYFNWASQLSIDCQDIAQMSKSDV